VVGKPSLGTLQSAVALIAGITSIAGATYSALGSLRSEPAAGQIVAVVRDGATDQPVRGALVEILTPEDDLVTTVAQDDDGVARRAIAPGTYRVRIAHPDFVEATRDVHVLPAGAAEMRVALERGSRPARMAARASREPGERGGDARPPSPGRIVDRGVAVTRRVLGRLGF
jgi:hypothetical protein